MNPAKWTKTRLGVGDLNDKPAVIKKVLELFKASQYTTVLQSVDALQKLGFDWPELDTIKKSAVHEIETKQQRG